MGLQQVKEEERSLKEKTNINLEQDQKVNNFPEEKVIGQSDQNPQGYDESVLLSLKNLDRSLSILNTVATLIGALITLFALIFTIAGATGFIQIRRWRELKKEVENDARVIKNLKEKAESDLENLRKNVEKSSATVSWPVEWEWFDKPYSKYSSSWLDEFGRKLDNYEALGLRLKYKDYYYRGLDYLNKEKYELALRDFERAIELNELDADNWLGKGKALYELEKYDEAINALSKAIELSPANEEAWYERGHAFYNIQEYEKASKDFEKVIQLEPEDFAPWICNAYTLHDQGKFDKALEAYNKAIDLNPEFEYAWFYRAELYAIKKDKENALNDLSKAIELNPKLRKEAKEDKDFEWLWDDEDFKKITQKR